VGCGLSQPHPRQPLRRRPLDPRHGPRRAAHPPDPQRDVRRRDRGRGVERSAQPRPARDHVPLRPRAARRGRPRQTLLERFIAGQLATLRELTLFLAPNINSYKRFTVGSPAPTAIAWGLDNRTCALRVVGHGASRRVECRLPGADVNPHLALAALIAGGLHGIDHALPLEEPYSGNAFLSDKPRVPATLREASELFGESPVAREAFGDEVVEHYVEHARAELDAFDAAVTDWERFRGFERL
jgi:glutamine synthetase